MGHPAVAEVLARMGFDWVCVDMEHGAIGIETMADIFRTLDAFDCVPVVRVPLNDPVWIHRCLDAGARGLIVPMVNSAAQAEAALREAKYPPRGKRGIGYCRANMHSIDFKSYFNTANDQIAVIMQIEHKDAIADLDAILDVDGVDGVFIGPMDLSGSMGITGQLEHPKMRDALGTYLRTCAEHRKAAGLHVVRPGADQVRAAMDQGYTMIALGLDNIFMQEGAAAALKAAGRGGSS